MPTSLRFAADKFKNGSDPFSLYKRSPGLRHDGPADVDGAPAKYDVIHYLRETYLKPHNPTSMRSDALPRQASQGHDFWPAGCDGQHQVHPKLVGDDPCRQSDRARLGRIRRPAGSTTHG